MAIDPTTTTTVKVSELASAGYNTTDLIPHEVAGILKKGNLQDLATFIGGIISTEGAVGFRAVTVTDGQTLPATTEEEFILVGPGTYPNVGGGSAITTTEPLNALVSNGTYWFIGVEIPIGATGVWGTISGTLDDQTDLKDVLDLKADLVDGKVPSSQLPSYVDDVVEVANYAALPSTGETGKIYLTLDNNKIYRWSGSAYIEIADNNAVWGMITGTLSSQTDLNTALGLKVPYTGATGNVDLGSYKLTASDLVVNHTSGSGTAATISKGGNGEALTVTKSSGSGNVASFAGGVTSISELHLTTDLADDYIASAATWNAKQSALNGTGFVKASGTTISYDNTTYVPTSRRLTINGTDYDLTADRSWTILSGAWGYISGTLSDQEDLQDALDLKATDASVVKITTDQNIRGIKTFLGNQTATTLKLIVADYYNDGIITSDNGMLRLLNGTTELFNLASTGDLTAKSFVKTGGTASQFLKANGTVDSTTYLSGTVAIANGGTGATTASAARTNLGATTIGSGLFTLPNAGLVSFLRVNADNTVELLGADLFRTSIGAGTGNGSVTSVSGTGSYGGLTLTGTVTGSGDLTLGGTPEGTWPISVSGNAASVNTVQVSTNADFYLTFADANNGSPTSEFLYTIGSVKVNPSTGALTAGSFVKSGGLSTEYLMADGSVSTGTGGTVSGTGTTNYIPKFTGTSAIGNSLIYDNGTNVGIGNESPSSRFFIKQNINSFNGGLRIEKSDNDTSLFLFNNGSANIVASSYGSTGSYMPLSLQTSDLDRLYITSGGNVGIGVTPSAWNSIFTALELNGGSIYTYNSNPGLQFVTNAYFDSVGWKYKNTNAAALYDQASGTHKFFNAPSGTAGAAFSFTETMRITSGGNVGIGTTSPSYKLSIQGSAGIEQSEEYFYFNSTYSIGNNARGKIRAVGAGGGSGYGGDLRFSSRASNNVWNEDVLTIANTGNVGIGTTSPSSKLHVDGNIYSSGYFNSNNIYLGKASDLFTGGSANDGGLMVSGSNNLIFGNALTERMRITSGGNVLIGTTSDVSGVKMNVFGNTRISGPSTILQLHCTTGTAQNWWLGQDVSGSGDGTFYLYNQTSGVQSFNMTKSNNATFAGNVTATGFFNSSDNRLKDLTDYDYNVSDIKPITYLWKDGRDNKKHVGYSAQEVQKVMPDAVNEGTDGMLSVNYVEVLVAKIAELENRIKQLEK